MIDKDLIERDFLQEEIDEALEKKRKASKNKKWSNGKGVLLDKETKPLFNMSMSMSQSAFDPSIYERRND